MKDTTKSIIYGATPIALYIIQTSSTEYVQKFQHALTLLTQDQNYSTCFFSIISNILIAICFILMFVMATKNNVTKLIQVLFMLQQVYSFFDQYTATIQNHLYTNVITQFTYNNISLIVITTVIMIYNLYNLLKKQKSLMISIFLLPITFKFIDINYKIIIYGENILNNQELMHLGNADSIDAREEI